MQAIFQVAKSTPLVHWQLSNRRCW